MRIPLRRVGLLLLLAGWTAAAGAYENFKVAVYARAQEVARMSDPAWLEQEWQRISAAVHVDKVYLEVHRDGIMPDDKTIEAAKAFFAAHGVQTAGGITFTINEGNRFQTFSYDTPADRKRVQMIAEAAARHFDEVILDDFFFTSAKTERDIEARGNENWTQHRLKLMTEAGRDLVVGPAKRVNPKVKVIIKYPNWYEHFQALGFNLETGPQIFDGIYTGTETRDAVRTAQHLQPYHGYSIMRYFENVAPGRNGGGWVDPYGSSGYDRYAEQLWLTLFARSGPQVTLFDWSSITRPLGRAAPGVPAESAAAAAKRAFDAIDPVLGKLGKPLALRSYKPFQSVGEDHLQSFLGMIGLPMEILPRFPDEDPLALLTEEAAADPKIVAKIEQHIRAGKSAVITSGLLRKLQSRGIDRIAEIEVTDRVALVSQFLAGRGALATSDKPVLIPQLAYRTNDSWELVSAIDGDNGWPLLHDADYAKGHLYVLVVPENFADFYNYPAAALNEIRRVLSTSLPVRLEAPSKVSLFAYDNGTFVVHNFRDEAVQVTAVRGAGNNTARIPVSLPAHAWQAFGADGKPL
ncbi:MAG TPA: hypothetical protein VMH77_08605 [Steroidobacteraceae bacterium]|nr:hypothetical protein [Steroidobacteraceae bacterium]